MITVHEDNKITIDFDSTGFDIPEKFKRYLTHRINRGYGINYKVDYLTFRNENIAILKTSHSEIESHFSFQVFVWMNDTEECVVDDINYNLLDVIVHTEIKHGGSFRYDY